MDIERAKELLPIIQAFAEGKTVQFLDGGKWADVYETDFHESPVKYRIKPESKYRPFESAQECIEEMMKHEPFGWVKDKPEFGYKCSTITSVFTSLIKRDEAWYGPKEMFQYSTFLDGYPFGIKVEDEEE